MSAPTHLSEVAAIMIGDSTELTQAEVVML